MRNEFVQIILNDDHLTRGLMDPEARLLIEWLVDAAEHLFKRFPAERASRDLRQLMRRCRALKRFIILWCYEMAYGPAAQLIASEGFLWPLPHPDVLDGYALLEALLECENIIDDEMDDEEDTFTKNRLAA